MKVYFCGSMTGSREKQENYEIIIDFINEFATVINPFVKDKEVIDYDPEYIFKRDSANMKACDIVVADITIPSTGVGFELGNFYNLDKPVLVVYDENFPSPSTLPRGADKFLVKSYNTIEEEKNIIKAFLEENI